MARSLRELITLAAAQRAAELHAHFDAVLPILVACADNDEESVRGRQGFPPSFSTLRERVPKRPTHCRKCR